MNPPRSLAGGIVTLALLSALLAGGPAAAAQEGAAPRKPGRVVVFGIDGADAEIFERLRSEGRLPNFDALAKRGCYARLATTNPAQSPVSWAAFSNASNPGKTGIYDFVMRPAESPGNLSVSLARVETVDGPVGPSARLFLPFGLGAGLGLLAYGLVLLVLRLFRAVSERARRLSAAAAGLVAALLAGAASHQVLVWVPERIPRAVSNRLGVPLWSVLGQAGVESRVLEAPVAFPADRAPNLRLLTGLGTPDVQGQWAFYEVFTDDPREIAVPETNGLVDGIVFDADGAARSRVYGPPNVALTEKEKRTIADQADFAKALWEQKVGVPSARRFEERVWQHALRATQTSCVLEIRRDPASRTAAVRVGVGGPRPVLDLPLPNKAGPAAALPAPGDSRVRWGSPVVLKEREWSEYVEFEFVANPLVKVKGIGRFWLESAGADGKPFRLVLGPISFDPRDVPLRIDVSWPRDYAPSLASKAGLYNLVGWPCLTNPVKDGMLSDEAFVKHARIILEERRRKLRAALADPGWKFLFAMFSEVDRVQHAFFRHVDPKSPRHDPEAAKVYGGAVDEFYVAMDSVLGEILAATGPGDAVLVMSDHGFASFRRGVNLNNWLLDHGFQVNAAGASGTGPDRDVNELFSGTNFFRRIDWAATKAYAVGLGGIYVNLEGRERDGSVDPARYDEVCAGIRRGLLELRDGDGSKVVHEVYLGKDLYEGPSVRALAPDLIVGFEKGYRVSWQTSLGGGGAAVIENNQHLWSGDHCSVDPSLVPGILVSSEPLRAEGASVMDVAPTVLGLFGVPAPPEWDGKSLLPR